MLWTARYESLYGSAGGRCEYCLLLAQYEDATLEIDHIIAEKHRGKTLEENLALACFTCNNHKGPNIAGIDPLSGNIIPLFHPRLQNWGDHFRYDGGVLLGLNLAGRATVMVLEINWPYRVSHREALIEEGVFPPLASSSI